MIGNDIIDISLARTSRWEEQRFKNKVFTNFEIEKISFSKNEAAILWQIWSMKEAAYKAHQRRFRLNRKFNPKELKCFFIEGNLGNIMVNNHIYYTQSKISENCIYTTATLNPYKKVSQNHYYRPVDLYSQMLKKFAALQNLQLKDLKIKKSESSIPYIFYKNERISTSFSLSHHGKFSAFALEVNEVLNLG